MLTLTDLNECFFQAKETGSRFVAVRINIGLNKEEVIINPSDNFDSKQAYYNQAYGEDLRHKYSGDQEIRITGYVHGDTFAYLESELEFYDLTGATSLN